MTDLQKQTIKRDLYETSNEATKRWIDGLNFPEAFALQNDVWYTYTDS